MNSESGYRPPTPLTPTPWKVFWWIVWAAVEIFALVSGGWTTAAGIFALVFGAILVHQLLCAFIGVDSLLHPERKSEREALAAYLNCQCRQPNAHWLFTQDANGSLNGAACPTCGRFVAQALDPEAFAHILGQATSDFLAPSGAAMENGRKAP